jgi:RimJ/RimL family protein N-acetyltransferase
MKQFSITSLKTHRTHARKLKQTDTQAIFDIFSDAEVCRYWSSEAMTELTEAEKFLQVVNKGAEDGSLLEWGIIETATDQLIGTCAYSSWDKKHQYAEIGFALHRDYWGKGLMKEFLNVFIPFGFEVLGLHRIEADVDPRNEASITLLEQLGFTKEGYLRERYHLHGEIQDSVIYGLLKHEFGQE